MIVDILSLLTIVAYVFVCPYTKVEESFNMQAIYDHLHFGTNISSYDHLQFPGVVPRTFLGSLMVAVVSLPAVHTLKSLGFHGVFHQMACRISLGFLTWLGLVQFRKAIQRKFSKRAAQIAMIFIALQFHFCFYASRTLPNTFAVLFALYAFTFWLQGKALPALLVLGATAVIFRCDMIVLVASMALAMLISKEITFIRSLVQGVLTCLVAMLLTIAVDSYFWQNLLWPEGVVLFFNTVENKSSEWGTHPWHWYFTNALPKSQQVVLGWVLVAVGIVFWTSLPKSSAHSNATPNHSTNHQNHIADYDRDPRKFVGLQCRRALYYLSPAVIFIALYSILPHKELRFIMPALPLFALTAAVSADSCLTLFCASRLLFPLSLLHSPSTTSSTGRRKDTAWTSIQSMGAQLALVGSWLLMLVFAHIFLLAAQHNYPGGEALEHFVHHFVKSEAAQHLHYDLHSKVHVAQTHLPPLEPSYVHLDNLAATTGVTRFLQERFVHHHHVNPKHSQHTEEEVRLGYESLQSASSDKHNKEGSDKKALPRRILSAPYAPHLYLNSLPGDWQSTLQQTNSGSYATTLATSEEMLLLEEDLLVYSKHEDLLDTDKTEFDFLITESPREFLESGQFVVREAIRGFERMDLSWENGLRVVLRNKLYILENTMQQQYARDD